MNQEIKIIKKKYGEKMAHLCTNLFPTLLDIEGLLSEVITSKFNEDKFLYEAIVANN